VGTLVRRPTARRLPGRRHLRWALTLALAAAAGLAATTIVQRAEQARAAYGESRTVAVATTDLLPGHEVGPADVDWVARPTLVVADDPAPDPVGRVVAQPVARGEVVLDRRLAGPGRAGPTALAPPGGRLLTVPAEVALPPLAVGDRVDAYAPSVLAGTGAGAPVGGARRVARDAVVAAVDERGVTIAVEAAEAAAVARAVLEGAATLAVAAPG
jgi:Flp pilus assembly protein CpaB